MAQTAGLLLPEGKLAVLAGVERARFHRPVVPGDRVTYRARRLRHRLGLLKAEVQAQVDEKPVAEATILLMEVEDVGEAG